MNQSTAAQDVTHKMDQESFDVIRQITADTDVVAKLADGATVPLGAGGFSTFRLWGINRRGHKKQFYR